jgi:hypothetical protein
MEPLCTARSWWHPWSAQRRGRRRCAHDEGKHVRVDARLLACTRVVGSCWRERLRRVEVPRSGHTCDRASRMPLVEAAAVPTALLALAWAGVWSRETGAMLTLGAAILQITGWGRRWVSLRRIPGPRRHPWRAAGDTWCCPARPGGPDSLIKRSAPQSPKACDDRSPGGLADWRACG